MCRPASLAVLDQVRRLERELAALKGKLASAQGDDMLAQAVDVKGAKVLAAKLEGADINTPCAKPWTSSRTS
jgi:alanyl-tRNA synthetase